MRCVCVLCHLVFVSEYAAVRKVVVPASYVVGKQLVYKQISQPYTKIDDKYRKKIQVQWICENVM